MTGVQPQADAAMSGERAIARALAGDPEGIRECGLAAPALVDVADAQGVSALLWESLATAEGDGARLRAALEGRARAAATRELLVRAEMQRVLDAIGSRGARVVVIKGSALAYTVYAQPWHRPRTDTDLLTSRDEVGPVSAALESCGYSRSDAVTSGALVSHQAAFERTEEVGLHHVVDLHWKIVNPQVLADVLSFEEIWTSAQPAPALGAHARVPPQVASAALACVHRLAHHQGQDRLVWLYDLLLLASRFEAADWRAFGDLAVSRRIAAICLDGFTRARQELDSPLPPEVATRLEDAGAAEPSRQYVESAVRRRDVLVSDLATLPTWRARLRLLREHAFPPPAFIRQRYGVRSSLWLPALYCHRLVTGACKWARH